MFEKLLVKLGILEEIIEEYDVEDEEVHLERRERIAEALHRGMLIVVDLRKVDREVGQSALDFICGVAYATKGAVMRIAPGVFLAMPDQSLVEEWHRDEAEEKGQSS